MKARIRHLSRLAVLAGIAGIGTLLAWLFGWEGVEHSWLYILVASALLCFGLYMAVYGIDRAEAKRHWRVVTIAVTFGVFAKYLLIFASAFLLTQDWKYAILGMAVAQIDPLSVAALEKDERMTPRTRTVLAMWASFDDPMTAIATPFILGLAASKVSQNFAEGESWTDLLLDLVPFILALLVVGIVTLRTRMNKPHPAAFWKKIEDSEKHKTGIIGLIGAVATPLRLYSGAALTGWFIRPKWLGGRAAELAVNTALYGATFLLGILLAGGVDIRGGIILGIATYGSQILVAWLVVWLSLLVSRKEGQHKLSKRDTWHLALAQQNGITAIVLALNLEPFINGAVAAVSLAIVVINLLNFAVNWVFDRHFEPRLQD